MRPFVILIVTLACFAPWPCAFAEDHIPLFNGVDLDGWHAVGGGVWSVTHGEIVGERGDGRYGWLVTDARYRDFVLSLEFKIEARGNSGVQFRSHVIDGHMFGYQAEVDPRPDHGTGGIYEEKGRGWLAKPDAHGLAAMRVGEWNHYRIEAVGDRLRLAVNGITTVDIRDDRTTMGHIALQVHSGDAPVRVRWRNLALAVRHAEHGYQRQFAGGDLTGWKPHGQQRWAIDGRQLVGESVTDAYGYLVSDATYEDVAIRLRYRVDSGNSGVFLRSVLNGLDIRGPQVEVTGQPGEDAAGIYGSGLGGWIAKPDARANKVVIPGEWNDLDIVARGDRIRANLNGWLVSDATDERLGGTGHLALQLHSGGGVSVRFADVRVKPLD